MSLSSDAEQGFHLVDIDMDDAKRRTPPNSRKVSGHDEHAERDSAARGRTGTGAEGYLHLGRGGPNYSTAGDEKSLGRRASTTTYGWLHQQSGYIFLLVVFLAFLRAGLHAAAPHSPSPSVSASFAAKAKSWIPLLGSNAAAPHPIPGLMDVAEARFRAKVARQSSSLPAAVAEYKRRYARPPPAGFDKWYNFALKHNFVMIDEFDAVVDDLEPFWKLEGWELRERAALVGALPSVDLVRVREGKADTVRGGDGKWEDSEVSARANGFKAMLGKFVKDLPDMDFPINAKAEGRVVVPWEHTQYPNVTQDSHTILDPGSFRPDWAGSGSVWDAWRRTCDPTAPAAGYTALESVTAQAHPGVGTGNAEFAFVRETGAAAVDFCDRPAARYEQGHFFSDWRVLPVLVPVFSPARAAGFGDIRVPSHYYYGGTKRYTYAWDPINLEQRKVDAMEVPWEQKRDVVGAWRGASTGGGSSPPVRISWDGWFQTTDATFPSRFVRMSSVGFTYTTVPIPLAALNADVMDTAFVKAVVPVGAEHRFGDSTELGVAWGYKYLLDLDGMGYSGRFMAFLASDSVPVKATVYDEFFSGWIEPWVHYIPLSPTYAEIYNIVSYFSGPPPSALRAAGLPLLPPPPLPSAARPQEEGDRRLRRIARAGKQWKQTIGRTVDMEVYVYRLALEYARLWADDREAMSYKP
ncbi:hypothetical protein B0H12DRAFT_1205072 [Mycena haematopus]|nr:hypothetical protein B0H12DRAFT_1205072 [Mycena haematopus]